MTAAPQYIIGSTGLFTSDDLATDAKTLDGQIQTLDNADWSAPPQDLFDAWFAFVAEWRGWYSSTFDYVLIGPAWNDANRDQLIQFEQRFASFAGRYQLASGNTLPVDVIAPGTGPKDSLADLLAKSLKPLIPSITAGQIWLVLGAVAAVGIAVYFRAPLARALKSGAA